VDGDVAFLPFVAARRHLGLEEAPQPPARVVEA
jgi:hypothetical protein